MISNSYGDITLLRFERLFRESGLAHAVTTCPQNYAPHRGLFREQAISARRKVCEILSLPFEKLTSPSQVHGAEVVTVESADIGCGREGRESAMRFVDGLVCDLPGVPLILLSADCPLVCVYDPDRPAVGAVHASWQGTVAWASKNLVHQMVRAYRSDPSRLLAAIAPSAGPCCYEVGWEVYRIAQGKLDDCDQVLRPCGNRFLFDLWLANRHQLMDAGITDDHIEVSELCTICDHRFWSHRRQGPEAGRTALFLGVR